MENLCLYRLYLIEDWYDTDWNLLDVFYFSPIKKNQKLLSVAEKLSQDFPYVRVDLYVANNQIYFGELTFRPYEVCSRII